CITFLIGLAAPSMGHLGAVHPASRIAALFIFRSLIATAAKWPYRVIPEMYLSPPSGSFFLCYPRTGIPTGTRMWNWSRSSSPPTSSAATSFNCTADPLLAHPPSLEADPADYGAKRTAVCWPARVRLKLLVTVCVAPR